MSGKLCYNCQKPVRHDDASAVICAKCHGGGWYSNGYGKGSYVREFPYGWARYDSNKNLFFAVDKYHEHIKFDKYGNEIGGEFLYCSFPDCGCPEARLCMAKNGAGSSKETDYDYDEQPTQQRRASMNKTTAVFLINKNVRAIKATYDKPDVGKQGGGEYTFKSLDATIKPDDFVVVPTDTRHGMTVVKVTETDVDIDLDSSIEYKWIVCKVDKVAYEKVLVDEAEAVRVIRLAEFNKKRADLREGMLGASMADIQGLAITALSATENGAKGITQDKIDEVTHEAKPSSGA